jgi:predicted amidohydrolase YtcJ
VTNVSTTLLVNGRVHSPTHPDASAMAVRDGTVAWLGSDDVAREEFAGADVIDLEGGFVAPAFVDGRRHRDRTACN